jgi:hypothetical protein
MSTTGGRREPNAAMLNAKEANTGPYGFDDDDTGSLAALRVRRWPYGFDDDDTGSVAAIRV